MARDTAHIGTTFGKGTVHNTGKETEMAISTVGYPRTARKLHLNPMAGALAIVALAAAAVGVSQFAMDGSGAPNTAPGTAFANLSRVVEPHDYQLYLVATEEQKAAVIQAMFDAQAIRDQVEGAEPFAYEVIVISAGAPDAGLQAAADIQAVRGQDGLPFTLVDLR